MKKWKARVRSVYSSLEELKQYDSKYGIVGRCHYDSAEKLWEDNPKLEGGINPADFGLAKNFEDEEA